MQNNNDETIIYKLSYLDLETSITTECYYNCHAKASYKAIQLLNDMHDGFVIYGNKAKPSKINDIDNTAYPDMIRQRFRVDDCIINTIMFDKIERYQMGYTTIDEEDRGHVYNDTYTVSIEKIVVE